MTAGQAILQRRGELAAAIVQREFDAHPGLAQRFGAAGRRKSEQDAGYHLAFLGQALDLGRRDLFEHYIGWVKVVLDTRGVPPDVLHMHLQHMADVLRDALPAADAREASDYIDTALAGLPATGPVPALADAPQLARDFLDALLVPDKHAAGRMALDAVQGGLPVQDLYLQVLQPVMHEVGRLWQTNRITVAQEHYCSQATQRVMSQLYPYILNSSVASRSLVATCASGELHEIGARMVAEFFEMGGWNAVYLGANTPTRDIVAMLVSERADVLAISCAYAPNLGEVRELIAAVRANPACAQVKVLVGGYPFNACPDLWKEVGADGWGRDASDALACANRLVI